MVGAEGRAGGAKVISMYPLSQRQCDVLALLAEGGTDAEIAKALGVKVTTVHRHVLDIRVKLGARNRAHAVALGFITGALRATR